MGRVTVSYPRLRRILVPLDFSGLSRAALRYAVPIAQKFGARIVLLHVLSEAAEAGKTTAQLRAAALKRLVATGVQLIPRTLHIDNVLLTGNPAEQIVEAISRRDIDLVVLATKPAGTGKRGDAAGTADGVLRATPCPVLFVRRR
jgi:nucleotide-binding universal stress UspA family protein